MADVENMARNDWPRYAKWDAHQKKIAMTQQQHVAAQQRQFNEYQSQWGKFAQENDAKLMSEMPELSDPKVMDKVAQGSLKMLHNEGFSQDDIQRLWNGQASVSLRDARVQKLILYAHRYLEAKETLKTAKVAPTPPKVQRPGSPVERVRDSSSALSALDKKLDSSGKWKDAAELLIARRRG